MKTINFKSQLCLIIISAFILFVAGCKDPMGRRNSGKNKPNVVIILTDDLGYGDISCYGQNNYQTPEIDKIAKQGVKFTDFYVPTPYCAPSRATLLTGRFPLRHGLVQNPTPDAGIDDIGISSEEVTLGEVFQGEGYKTKCIGKWHLGHKEEFFPVNHGFDEYFGILYSNDMRPVQLVENKDTIEYPVEQNLLTQRYTGKAIEYIEKNKTQPFFLFLSHAMPHKPLAASKRFYTPESPGNLYADVLHELDWSVGKVMTKLEELKILDKTIVIFMSDNGPWYGGSTGGLKGMKATTWEGGIRVPFIIRYPGVIPQNTTVKVPCASVDVFSTLLSLAGLSTSLKNKVDGEDITDIIKGERASHSVVFSMQGRSISTVRKGDWKLFVRAPNYKRLPSDWVDPRGPDGKTIIAPIEGQATPDQYPGVVPSRPQNEIQLFNLRSDSIESVDLAKDRPEIVEELMVEYRTFFSSLNNEK
ncbi:sulfatase family protein [Marinilabilia sp.]